LYKYFSDKGGSPHPPRKIGSYAYDSMYDIVCIIFLLNLLAVLQLTD